MFFSRISIWFEEQLYWKKVFLNILFCRKIELIRTNSVVPRSSWNIYYCSKFKKYVLIYGITSSLASIWKLEISLYFSKRSNFRSNRLWVSLHCFCNIVLLEKSDLEHPAFRTLFDIFKIIFSPNMTVKK